MRLSFSSAPGAHERRLQRLANNPLFASAKQVVDQQAVNSAKAADQDDHQRFQQDFHALIKQAVNLEANVESEVLLNLKEELDRAYERCSSLPGDQSEIKTAIAKLIAVVMHAVRQQAENDPMAIQKLDDEDAARRAHFLLQGFPLVADLMREDGVIEPDELVPTLLNESLESLAATLQLFDPAQLALITQEGRTLLSQLGDQGLALPEAWQRLSEIEAQAANEEYSING